MELWRAISGLTVPVLFQAGMCRCQPAASPACKGRSGRLRSKVGQGGKRKGLNKIACSVSLGENQQAGARTRVCLFSIKLVLGLTCSWKVPRWTRAVKMFPVWEIRRGKSPTRRRGLTSGSPACSSWWPPGSSSAWDPSARPPPWWVQPPVGTAERVSDLCGPLPTQHQRQRYWGGRDCERRDLGGFAAGPRWLCCWRATCWLSSRGLQDRATPPKPANLGLSPSDEHPRWAVLEEAALGTAPLPGKGEEIGVTWCHTAPFQSLPHYSQKAVAFSISSTLFKKVCE